MKIGKFGVLNNVRKFIGKTKISRYFLITFYSFYGKQFYIHSISGKREMRGFDLKEIKIILYSDVYSETITARRKWNKSNDQKCLCLPKLFMFESKRDIFRSARSLIYRFEKYV